MPKQREQASTKAFVSRMGWDIQGGATSFLIGRVSCFMSLSLFFFLLRAADGEREKRERKEVGGNMNR